MITDDQLYQLAIFLGSLSVLLIVLYHFLEVNAEDDTAEGVGSEKVLKAAGAIPDRIPVLGKDKK